MKSELLDLSLLPPGSHVLCAVSGGADSVCLLALLRERRELKVSCAHYNHCLRGEESERDESFVRELCGRWGVPLHVGRGDVRALAAARRLSLETAAREARYEFLQRTAEQCGAALIATGHTANDQAETVLFRLARGTALRGLGGIPAQRGNLVRPLLHATRREILDYLAQRGIPHVEDSSNEGDEAARNRLRHGAIPAMESVNSAALRNIQRMTTRLREDEEYLRGQAERICGELYDGESLPFSELCALPAALRRRVLEQAAGRTLSLEESEAVLALRESDSPSAQLDLSGLRAERRYERLFFVPAGTEPAPLTARELRAGDTLLLPEAGCVVSAEILPPGREIHSSFNTFSFSCGMICGTLKLTARQEGDQIRFSHRQGTHSLRRLMIDARIPRQLRKQIPVLRDEEGVLAVYGFGQAERALAREGEAQLRVTITKEASAQEEK